MLKEDGGEGGLKQITQKGLCVLNYENRENRISPFSHFQILNF